MKNATLPPLRVDTELRAAVESVLREGETLSSFMLEAVQLNVERRETQREFIARGLHAREEARTTGGYVEADEMLSRLDAVLARTDGKADSS